MNRFIRCVVFACFLTNLLLPSAVFAQGVPALNLPKVGAMLSTSPAFAPAIIKGITVHPENPLQFDFIIDPGDDRVSGEELKAESLRMVKYFLASLTVPEKELWVNLSPYEKDRIIPDSLGTTEMGRDMLAQDYILKQLTASLVYPEKELGKKFWQNTYRLAQEKFGSTNIPVNTFNKVWIIPQNATVYEHNGSAFVVNSHLKVMLEEDYLALDKNNTPTRGHVAEAPALAGDRNVSPSRLPSGQRVEVESIPGQPLNASPDINALGSQVVREILLPELEKEVNQGKNFANLRQIYSSMILAIWYKKNLKASLLNQVYSNRNKTKGIDLKDRSAKEKIYQQYLEAFKKGVYNYIKEDHDPTMGQSVPRKYFSGGLVPPSRLNIVGKVDVRQRTELPRRDHAMAVTVDLRTFKTDRASVVQVMTKDPLIRFQEIKASNHQEFSIVAPDKDIPVGAQYVLDFYDQKPGEQNPLRTLIEQGHLRVGVDPEHVVRGILDGNDFIIFTDSENKKIDEILVNFLTPDRLAEYRIWIKTVRNKWLETLAYSSESLVVTGVSSLKKYGIFEMFQDGNGGYRPITVGQIIDHVKGLPAQKYYHNPSRQQIHKLLRELSSLGWLKGKGEETPTDDTEYTLTPKGQDAIRFADRYTQVADFMPKFTRTAEYLFARKDAPKLKEGALTLRQLADLSSDNWGVRGIDEKLAKVIRWHLNGYLEMNLLLAMYLDPEFSRGDLDLPLLRGTLLDDRPANAVILSELEKLGVSSDQLNSVPEDTMVEAFNRAVKIPILHRLVNVEQYRSRLPLEAQELLKKADTLDDYGHLRLNTALWKIIYAREIKKDFGGVLKLFDKDLEISIERIRDFKNIQRDVDELEAAFDIFVNSGFLIKTGSGKYRMTSEGVVAMNRPLVHGVNVSYRPMFDREEEVLFDSLSLGEAGVYRDINVLGSGDAHDTYFRQMDEYVGRTIRQNLDAQNIPAPAELIANKKIFVMAWSDTGSGDGKYLAHLYHFIRNQTQYGQYMRENPDLYKLEMVGVDYNSISQDLTKQRLDSEQVPNITLWGDVSAPKRIVNDVSKRLKEKYKILQASGSGDPMFMVFHTRTFLDHNRPWTEILDKEAAKTNLFNSTAVFGWDNILISNGDFGQNLFEHMTAWREALEEAGQSDLFLVELLTIDPDIAAENLSRTLTVAYNRTHQVSNQFLVELDKFRAIAQQAGWQIMDEKPYPPGMSTVVVMHLAIKQPVPGELGKRHEGGINFDPAMFDLQIKRDSNGVPLPAFQQPIGSIKIDGFMPVIIRVAPVTNLPLLLGIADKEQNLALSR